MRKVNDKTKEPFLAYLGDAIRVRRTDLLLSQEQLGVRARLHRTYITDIENGLRNMSLMTLQRVVSALKSKLSSPILAAERAMVVRKYSKKR